MTSEAIIKVSKGFALAAALFASLACAETRTLTTAELEELDAIDARLAPWECEGMKLSFEAIVLGGMGDSARATEIAARMWKRRLPPDLDALAKRRHDLLTSTRSPVPGPDAYSESKARRDAYCPWRKLEIPYDLPPARDERQAREYALVIVPNFLLGWRLCEIFFPDRRGQLDAAWAASPLAKLELPEFRKTTREVRAWLAQDIAAPAPGSVVDHQLRNPRQRADQLRQCDAMPAIFKRIEKAFPQSWLAAPDNR